MKIFWRNKFLRWFCIGLFLVFLLPGLLINVVLYIWGQPYGIIVFASPFSTMNTHQITLRALKIWNAAHEPIFSAQKIKIQYLPDLFFKGHFQESLYHASFEKPSLFFHRSSKGLWNTFFTHSPEANVLLKPLMEIHEGSIHITDDLWKNVDKPYQLAFKSIEGTLDFTNPLYCRLNLYEIQEGERGLHLSGTLLRPSFGGVLKLAVKDISVRLLANYFLHEKSVEVTHGLAKGLLHLHVGNYALAGLQGHLELHDGALVFPNFQTLSLTHVSSNVKLNHFLVYFTSIKGRLGKSTIVGQGVVSSQPSPSYFAFASPNINLEDLKPLSPIIARMNPSGSGNLNFKAFSLTGHLLLEGKLQAPLFLVNGHPAKNLFANVSFSDPTLFLSQTSFSQYGSHFQLRGFSEGDNASLVMNGANVPMHLLSSLASLGGHAVGFLKSAKGNSTFALLFHGNKDENILSAAGDFENPIYRNLAVRSLHTNLLFSKDEGWLDHIQISLPEGKMIGQGAWIGENNPFFIGEFQGSLFNTPYHPILLGNLDDGFLIDSHGSLHWKNTAELSGFLSMKNLPFKTKNPQYSLALRGSGTSMFHLKRGEHPSIFGTGNFIPQTAAVEKYPVTAPKARRGTTRSLMPLPQAAGHFARFVVSFASEPVGFNVATHHGKGNFLLNSPSLALAGGISGNSITNSAFVLNGWVNGFQTSLAGKLAGTFKNPELSSSLVTQGFLRNKKAALEGDFNYKNSQVSNAVLHGIWGDSGYDLMGNLLISQNPFFNLQGSVFNGNVHDIAYLFPEATPWAKSFSGLLTGSANLHGNLSQPEGELHFFVHDGEIFDEPFDTVFSDARIRKGVFYVDPFILRSYENFLIVRGWAELNGKAHLVYEIPQLSISDLHHVHHPHSHVRGLLKLFGTLDGTFSNPALSGDIDVTHLHEDHFHVDKVKAYYAYKNKNLQISDAQILNGSGSISGTGNFTFDHAPSLQTSLRFSQFDLSEFAQWEATKVLGLLHGQIWLSGSPSKLDGNFNLHLSKNRPVSGEAEGTVENSIANFSKLHLNVGEGEITGQGKFEVENPSTFHVQGNNLNLELISILLQIEKKLKGTANFNGTILTSIQNPQMDLQVDVINPSYEKISAQGLHGELLYHKGKLIFKKGLLNQPHGVLKLSGEIPFLDHAPLSIQLEIDNQSLALASDFFPGLSGKGPLNGKFAYTQTPQSYALNGNAQVKNGELRFPGMSNSIENLDAQLKIESNQANLNLTGSLGNPFQLQGTLNLGEIQYPNGSAQGSLQLHGKNLHLAIPPIADVQASADLALAKNPEFWKLSGNSTLETGYVNFSDFSSNFFQRLMDQFGPGELDTDVVIKPDMHFYHPHLQMQGGGELKLQGKLPHPSLSGELTGNRGTLFFLGYSFNVTQGQATFFPPHPLPYLVLEGESVKRIQGSRLLIKLEGYPEDLHLSLDADPPLSERELSHLVSSQQPVEQYLSGTSNIFAKEEASRWLNTGIQSEIFFPVENVFGSALSLEYFSFEFLPTGQIGLQIGKQISPHVALTYSHALSAVRLQSQTEVSGVWGIEYRLSPKVLLRVTQDNLTGYGGFVLSRWKF